MYGIEHINNMLSQSESGHLHTFAKTSETYNKIINGILTNIKESNEKKISIDTQFYSSVTQYLNTLTNNHSQIKNKHTFNKNIEKNQQEIEQQFKPSLAASTQHTSNAILVQMQKTLNALPVQLKKLQESLHVFKTAQSVKHEPESQQKEQPVGLYQQPEQKYREKPNQTINVYKSQPIVQEKNKSQELQNVNNVVVKSNTHNETKNLTQTKPTLSVNPIQSFGEHRRFKNKNNST